MGVISKGGIRGGGGGGGERKGPVVLASTVTNSVNIYEYDGSRWWTYKYNSTFDLFDGHLLIS